MAASGPERQPPVNAARRLALNPLNNQGTYAMANKSKLPPVPPEQVSPAGPGSATPGKGGLPEREAARNARSKNRNTEQQGRQGDTWQNTHHQGYQQDR
jgi:hypothetical protein